MLGWLAANAGTLAVCALVLVIVFFAARSLIRDRKQGKSPCGCSCSGCGGCGRCHSTADARGAQE